MAIGGWAGVNKEKGPPSRALRREFGKGLGWSGEGGAPFSKAWEGSGG